MPSFVPDPAQIVAALPAHRPLPPVEQWNPPLCGEMNLRITRDGVWHHEGMPIQREALVRLFASILRCDPDGCYYLVTPVEKWRIQVDLAPFLGVRLDVSEAGPDQILHLTTNIGDTVALGPQHPLTVEYFRTDGQPTPWVQVRGRLRALLTRAVFIELAELGEERRSESGRDYGVWSQGQFFSLGQLDDDNR